MKNKFKSALLPLMLLLAICLLCACGDKTRLDEVGEKGYTVSVRFEANGGEFTTNCYSIVDSFDISGMTPNGSGMVELALISPDNSIRGANDTFTVQNAGYFLAGWYERVENPDGTYSYTNKWDFENGRLTVDPGKTYSSSDPVLTLYAVWVPQFEINFYNLNTGELMKTQIFSPEETTLQVPQWDTSTGKINMYKFPTLSGYTFNGVYYDAEATQPAEGTLIHHGYVDPDTGVAVNPVMDVYIDWIEGDWYHIYTAAQLADCATAKGYYMIHEDLDFTDVAWPEIFSRKEFAGAIYGQGHTISNVEVIQNNNSDVLFGLFGGLGATAKLENVTFRNVTATIQAGVRVSGANYGLFAGTISADATLENVTLIDSTLLINPDCNLSSTDYSFGAICGMGYTDRLSYENIQIMELKPEVQEGEEIPADRLVITVDDSGVITVEPVASEEP